MFATSADLLEEEEEETDMMSVDEGDAAAGSDAIDDKPGADPAASVDKSVRREGTTAGTVVMEETAGALCSEVVSLK
jgi:F0F1-type ATP synthase alpha subunit